MNVPAWVWLATIGGLIVLLALDLFIVDRRGHGSFSLAQAGRWVTFYVCMAMLFGLGVWWAAGPTNAGEFFAGYLTEYSLSVDNLFIFYLIITGFGVAREHQHKVLLIGIVLALIFRGIFIAVGAAALHHFSWLFYVFGAFLLYTAYTLIRKKDEEEEFKENFALRYVKRVLPTTSDFRGAKVAVRENGKWFATPMLIVMVAIGSTDLMFALDSIPAIFGLTQDAFLVFTANAFALMGLRQLYFLLGGLLERLVYISYGLALILAFIGVKLFLHALHESGFAWSPEVPIWLSLTIIIGTLAVTTVASILKIKRDDRRAAQAPTTTEHEPVSGG